MLRRPANTDIDLSHIFPVFEHSDEGAHAFADATFGTVLPCNGALHAHVHQLRHPGGADARTRLHRRFWAQQQQKLDAEIAEEEAKRAKRAKKKARKKRAQELRRAQREMDAFEQVGEISDAKLKHSQ
jgi:hypothetical protein